LWIKRPLDKMCYLFNVRHAFETGTVVNSTLLITPMTMITDVAKVLDQSPT